MLYLCPEGGEASPIMKKKACPSCAMEIDEASKICPVCAYEFPRKNPVYQWVALFLVLIFLMTLLF